MSTISTRILWIAAAANYQQFAAKQTLHIAASIDGCTFAQNEDGIPCKGDPLIYTVRGRKKNDTSGGGGRKLQKTRGCRR